jgi:hypothetical protein
MSRYEFGVSVVLKAAFFLKVNVGPFAGVSPNASLTKQPSD